MNKLALNEEINVISEKSNKHHTKSEKLQKMRKSLAE